MYQYQIVRSAHCLKNGLTEEGQDPNKMTPNDYLKMKRARGVE